MIFGAYLGDSQHSSSWQQVMRQHAAWLGLTPQIEPRRLFDGKSFAFGWLKPGASSETGLLQEKHDYLVLSTSSSIYETEPEAVEQTWQRLLDGVEVNVIQLAISLQTGELRIAVPPAIPEQFYYTHDRRGYVFGNDMRLMMRWAGMELDECAVYALFRYLAIPPPLTMSKSVRRIPNGHTLRLPLDSSEPTFQISFRPGQCLQESGYIPDPEQRVEETIDSMLACVPTSAALLFSGGVDSGLVAARLARMGRRDVTLVNYAFGPEDHQARLALQMASHLGMTCEQVTYEPSDIPKVLERLGRDYTYPFGDVSLIPTNLLVDGCLHALGREPAVIDATGADGAFGMAGVYGGWERFYTIPFALRWLAAGGYKWLRLWQYPSSLEAYVRTLARTVHMPLEHAAVMGKAPLEGIAYATPSQVREYLEASTEEQIQRLGVGLDLDDQVRLLDLVHLCAGRAASKTHDPLRLRGVMPIYPFLEPRMLRLSSSIQPADKSADGHQKALLKRLLARSVPRDMVYRHKGYFVPPKQNMFGQATMQELLSETVLSPKNPLMDYVRAGVVGKMTKRTREGQPLSSAAYNFLWMLMFASSWLSQLEF